MSNFWKRALFGALFVVIVVGSVLGGEYTLLALLMLITVLGLWELYGLCAADGIYPQKVPGVILGVCLFIFAMINISHSAFDSYIGTFIFLLFFSIFVIELFRKKEKPFANIALTFFGVFYIPLTLFMFYFISQIPFFSGQKYHPHNLLGYFFILWSYDTGAYLAGSKFGKHRLWERLSPKKSWEGVFGGAILALAVAYFISQYYTDFSRKDWLIITFIIMITGTLGDLVKSMFKRSINIKDSGNIIPGHGGILDRFDALFLSAPFVLCYLFIAK